MSIIQDNYSIFSSSSIAVKLAIIIKPSIYIAEIGIDNSYN